MILFAHMLFGAAIGAKIYNPYFAVLFAFLGHYFLDLFPHVEYRVDMIKDKIWNKAYFDFIKVFLDFLFGILVIYVFVNPQSDKQTIIYLCALVAIVPDGLTLLNKITKNKILAAHSKIHEEKVHYLTKNKKFPIFWRIATQVMTIIVSVILLK